MLSSPFIYFLSDYWISKCHLCTILILCIIYDLLSAAYLCYMLNYNLWNYWLELQSRNVKHWSVVPCNEVEYLIVKRLKHFRLLYVTRVYFFIIFKVLIQFDHTSVCLIFWLRSDIYCIVWCFFNTFLVSSYPCTSLPCFDKSRFLFRQKYWWTGQYFVTCRPTWLNRTWISFIFFGEWRVP